jgi:hypothetical protein
VPGGGFTHHVQVDDTAIAWVTGEDGTFGYDGCALPDPLDRSGAGAPAVRVPRARSPAPAP